MRRHSSLLPTLLAALVGACASRSGPSPRPPVVAPPDRVDPAAPEPPEATALLELAEPTAAERGEEPFAEGLPEPVARLVAVPRRNREEVLAGWTALLSGREVLERAGEGTGMVPALPDVLATRRDRAVELRVRADGRVGALARCHALVRAAQQIAAEAEDSARTWLAEERTRVTEELAAEGGSLAEVVPDPREPRDAAALRSLAARWTRELEAATVERELDPTDGAEQLAALRRRVLAVRLERAEQLGRVGERHPDILAIDARLARLEAIWRAQRAQDLAYWRAVAADRSRSPARAALRATLAAPLVEGELVVPSEAPAPLRVLARALVDERLALATLGGRYGPAHPRLVVQEERARDVAQRLREELGRMLAELAAPDRPAGRPVRPNPFAAPLVDARIRHAQQLAELVHLLSERLRALDAEAERLPRYRVVRPCG